MNNATNNNIEVGCIAAVKVGRNEIPATILEILEDGFKVKSTATNKTFKVKTVGRVMATREECTIPPVMPEVPSSDPEMTELARRPIHGPGIDSPIPCDDEPETENPAPESATPIKAEKKMSLLDAAVEVLKITAKPMNTREMVKAAIESNLWTPTACKTPEQTLYGSIFREMSVKEAPRVRKSEQKGKFEFAG